MTPEKSKQLTPGTRVRITRTPAPKRLWPFFEVGETATLIKLDTKDDRGDWMAEFHDGKHLYIEPALVDFEVIYGLH